MNERRRRTICNGPRAREREKPAAALAGSVAVAAAAWFLEICRSSRELELQIW